MFTVVPFVYLFTAYGANFTTPIDPAFCFINGICYFLYRLLDEMDGKQARRTGNSSPMGLIFDHGCDAFTCGLQCLMFAKMAMVGDGHMPIVSVLLSCMPFYFATLEEYYVGALYLPVFNGITDGSIPLILINFAVGIMGSEWFTQTVYLPQVGAVPACHLAFYFIVITQAFGSIRNINEMVQAYFKPINPEEHYREPVNFVALFTQVVAYFAIVAIFCVFATHNQGDIVKQAPVAFALQFSNCQVHMAMTVMLAHMTRQKYNPFSKLYCLNFLGLCAFLVAGLFDVEAMQLQSAFYALCTVSSVCQFHFVVGMIFEISQALRIYVFKTKPVALKKVL
jgi:ethanolaminephosphotransferase